MATWPDTLFGFSIPQVFTETPVDLGVVRQAVTQAEAAGCHSLWTQSQLVGTADVLEPLTLLSHVAAHTERVRLGTSVLVVTEHAPLQLAKQLSSLDHLSAGRLIVGLGMGAKGQTLDGHDNDRPVRRLLETVDVMKAAWTQDVATVDGEIWQVAGASMNPKPLQRPHPPLWLGGHHPNALRRAVRHGQGWMGAGARPTAEFADVARQLRATLAEAGRSERDFLIAKRVYVAVESSREEAERRLRDRFAAYARKPARGPLVSVHGTPDDVRAGIDAVVGAGAALVVLNPVYDFLRQQEALLDLLDLAPVGVA